MENPRSIIVADEEVEGFENGDDKIISTTCCMQSTGGGTRGTLGALVPTTFTNAHRNLVFHNRNVSC